MHPYPRNYICIEVLTGSETGRTLLSLASLTYSPTFGCQDHAIFPSYSVPSFLIEANAAIVQIPHMFKAS